MAPLATAFVLVLPNMTAFPAAAAAGIRGANLGAAGAAQGAAFGAGFAKSAGKLMAAGVVVGLGVLLKDSVKAAGDFEAQMVRLVTSAGETGNLVSGNLKVVAEGIKAMAGPVGTTVEALGKAMYTVESGSFHGAEALKVLQAAAEGAKAEGADLTKVTNATTTALVDYHLSADHSAEVVTKLVAATAAGKTTFEQLTGALHSVLPVASAAGVSLDDILGSLAAMTLHGISAEQATQNLADAIRHMQNPTAVQAKELALLGLTTNQLADDLRTKGLSGTLGEISDRIRNMMPPGSQQVILEMKTALGKLSPEVRDLAMKLIDGKISFIDYRKAARDLTPIQAQQAMSFASLAGATHRIGDEQLTGAQTMQSYAGALAKATGDATGMNVALMLTGDNAGTTATAIGMVASATVEAGNHVKGWAEIQETFNFKMAAAKASLGVVAVAIGDGLLPVIGKLFEGITAVLGPVAQWISGHQTLTTIITTSLAAFLTLGTSVVIILKIGAALKFLAATLRLAAIAQFLFLSPWGLIILAITAVAAALVYAFFHFKGFHDWVIKAWGWLKTAGIAVWDALVVAFHAVADASVWLWQHALKPAFDGIVVVIGYWWEYAKLAFGFWKAVITDVVAPAVMWLWHNVLVPAFNGIVIAIGYWWEYAKLAFGFWKGAVEVVAAVIMWLWRNVYEPAFSALTVALKAWWEYAQVAFGFWKGAVEVVAAVVMWLWHNVYEPAFAAFSVVLKAWWVIAQIIFQLVKANLELYVIAPIERLWHLAEAVWPLFTGYVQVWWAQMKFYFEAFLFAVDALLIDPVKRFINVTEPIWRRIGEGIKGTWDNWIKPTFDFIAHAITKTLPDAFSTGSGYIGKAWDSVKGFVAAPVNAVIRFVLNDGIIKAWNTIAGWVGVKDRIPALPLINLADGGNVGEAAKNAYANGGRIFGFGGPRQDNIPIMASAGEYIIPAHVVSDMGVGFFDGIIGRKKPTRPGDGSSGISIGRYADGGIVGFLTDPLGWVGDRVNGTVDKIPGAGIMRDISVAASRRLIAGLVDWAKSKVSSIFSGNSSAIVPIAGAPGGLMAWLRAQAGKPYGWAQAGPSSYDCSGIVSAVWNLMHGANPYRHTFSTSGESLFFPKRNQYGLLTAGWANPGERGGGSVGHTAAIFGGPGGVGIESTGSRGVRIGAGTTDVRSFAHWGTFDRGGRWPNNTVGVNTSGRTEYVSSADDMSENNKLLRELIATVRGLGPDVGHAVGRELNGGVATLRQMARAH